MKVSYKKNLEHVIDYCEVNLSHEISLEELADKAGYSVFYFCRLFQAVTGCTPMEYMRKRRLSQAAMELSDTNAYIRDIGYKWGFNSHENFVRAFKKQFGVSPSLYRGVKSSLNLFHRIERINIPFCDDLILTPRFVEKPSFTLAGFLCRTTWEKSAKEMIIPKHWNNYHANKRWEKIGKKTDPSSRYDIGVLIDNNVGNGSFSYLIGVEVDDSDEIELEPHQDMTTLKEGKNIDIDIDIDIDTDMVNTENVVNMISTPNTPNIVSKVNTINTADISTRNASKGKNSDLSVKILKKAGNR